MTINYNLLGAITSNPPLGTPPSTPPSTPRAVAALPVSPQNSPNRQRLVAQLQGQPRTSVGRSLYSGSFGQRTGVANTANASSSSPVESVFDGQAGDESNLEPNQGDDTRSRYGNLVPPNLNNHPQFQPLDPRAAELSSLEASRMAANRSNRFDASNYDAMIDELLAALDNPLFDEPRNLLSSADANTTRYGVVQVKTAEQAFEAIKRWEPESLSSEPAANEQWANIAHEPNALQFAGILSNIESTEAYQNPVTRPGVKAQIKELMAEVFRSPEFRTLCFSTALTGSDSCHDRVALAFTDMSFALINYKADKGQYTLPTLLKMGCGLFRLEALDKIVLRNIEQQSQRYQHALMSGTINAGAEVDEVEVRLAYQSRLAGKLDLPAVAHDMRYFSSANVSPEELADAEKSILDQEHNGADLQFLAQWNPWQTAMQKRYPEVFEALKVKTAADRDWLVIPPKDMTSGEYIAACKEQSAQEAVAFNKIMVEQTKLNLADLNRTEST